LRVLGVCSEASLRLFRAFWRPSRPSSRMGTASISAQLSSTSLEPQIRFFFSAPSGPEVPVRKGNAVANGITPTSSWPTFASRAMQCRAVWTLVMCSQQVPPSTDGLEVEMLVAPKAEKCGGCALSAFWRAIPAWRNTSRPKSVLCLMLSWSFSW
jgi:hypothetical protein